MLRRTLFATAALLATVGAAQAQIRVATVGPMTGEYAAIGVQMKAGAEQAVADINKAGGVNGQQLILEVGDDACDPKQAVSVANQMASRKVAVVAGHYCSGSSIPASKVYAEEGVLQISPASTNPKYTDEGGWNTFRVCGRDDQQGALAGKFLADKFKGKKIAVIHDNSAYGKGLADETKKAMNAAGMTETLYTAYVAGERDYSALISRMKQAGIEVIYVGGYHTATGLIARQAKEQGMNVAIVGRRPGDERVLANQRTRRRGHGHDLPARPAQERRRRRHRRRVQGQELRPRGLYPLHLRRPADLGRGREEGQLRRGQESRRRHARRPALPQRPGQHHLRQEGRRDRRGLRLLRLEERQLLGDVRERALCTSSGPGMSRAASFWAALPAAGPFSPHWRCCWRFKRGRWR